MDHRTIIAIIVCILFYLGYTEFLKTKYPDYGKPPAELSQEEKAADEPIEPDLKETPRPEKTTTSPAFTATKIEQDDVKRLSKKELTIDTRNVIYEFDQRDSRLVSVKLKDYDETSEGQTQLVELIKGGGLAIKAAVFPEPKAQNSLVYHATRDDRSLRFSQLEHPWFIEQEFHFDEKGYGGSLNLRFTNKSNQIQPLKAGLLLHEKLKLPKSSSSFLPDIISQQYAFVVSADKSRDDEVMTSYCEDESLTEKALKGVNEKLDYIGFDHHYFLKLFAPKPSSFSYLVEKSSTMQGQICPITMQISQDFGQIKPSETIELQFKTYFGPKDLNTLSSVSETFASALDLGFLDVIAKPLLVAIKGIYKFCGNYGLAIIVLTVFLKLIFYPLTRAAAISSKNMQRFQPEMKRIREKYKDDKQAQQREIMAFMSKHKINPAKGCLPILPQLPVFFAFYRVLSQSIELRHAPFMGWISDLSAADPFFISPVLLGGLMFVQQKLTPNPTMDKTQEKVMLMMPIMFTFMMLTLPSGMVLYMITNSVVSILQQQWLNKRLELKKPVTANA